MQFRNKKSNVEQGVPQGRVICPKLFNQPYHLVCGDENIAACATTTDYAKILGVTFDSIFKSFAQATTICDKMKCRDRFLEALAGSTGVPTRMR